MKYAGFSGWPREETLYIIIGSTVDMRKFARGLGDWCDPKQRYFPGINEVFAVAYVLVPEAPCNSQS